MFERKSIEESLIQGERLTYLTTIHWFLMLVPLMALGMCIPFGIRLFLAHRAWASLVVVIAPLAWLLLLYFDREMIKYAVTSKRIISQGGIFGSIAKDLELNQVEGVEISQSLLGRLFGFGQVILTGTGGTSWFLVNVENPFELRKQVQEQLDSRYSEGR